MELSSFLAPRVVHDHPRSSSSDFVHVDPLENITAQALISRVKQTPETTQLLQLVEQARDLHVQQLFHFAAAIGMIMVFLPLETFIKELLIPNQSGMTSGIR
ncbi:hypothetical protein JG687_00010600 [Phytophthora cactorum]|uniref:Uncharacterized protein n=1 Tax=Phytophthora cactorum TaxID=29920 RepID=A0A329SL26_9STRA|nr:hypothetical protein Pcac1_g22906 [Phytophthora cactorum]KAG2815608.1 hypothetical protein PC112_g13801 [Phytophthora cactorum]KAG2873782.1 hypothetical protein PC114_g25665 [Phytophthora cactorum]KAG2885627.1 hypothetical protein PC117_g25545 [Phytophthora cactorum]KAG2964195.1 hypothetical protein PC119_g25297 [Phytophthora cactorum]